MSNLFVSLAKYGSSEEENYLTESFVLMLRQLLLRDESAAIPLMNNLMGIELSNVSSTPATILISTQVRAEGGIPDIEVRIPGEFHAYIEVKHDAHLGSEQLEYYKSILDKSTDTMNVAVLLTRSKASSVETDLAPEDYHHVCWYEVHRWFSVLSTEDEVLNYLIHDFNNFLEAKRMSHQQIKWEYEEGVPALIDFTDMLESVIGEVIPEQKMTRTAGWSWRGFYLNGEVFLGIRYDDPTRLVFENNTGNSPSFKRDFVFSDSHFFSLDAGEQFETLAKFLMEKSNDLAAFTNK